MTGGGMERDTASHEGLGELASRCAHWLAGERERMERELRAAYEGACGATQAAPDRVPRPDTGAHKWPRPVTRPSAPAASAPLIGLLDRLAELPPASGATEGEALEAVLDWVRRTVLAALATSGVFPVDDSGPVDPARHKVVATRADPSGRNPGGIAETVRPGYLWGGQVLRHQEVVAYVPLREPDPVLPGTNEEGGPPHDAPH